MPSMLAIEALHAPGNPLNFAARCAVAISVFFARRRLRVAFEWAGPVGQTAAMLSNEVLTPATHAYNLGQSWSSVNVGGTRKRSCSSWHRTQVHRPRRRRAGREGVRSAVIFRSPANDGWMTESSALSEYTT